MPILLPCDELEPGMRLYEPVISGNRVMLQSGKSLTPADIQSLNRRYPGLMVRIGDPLLDDLIEFEDDGQDREIAAQTQQKIAGAMSEVRERFSERASIGGAQCDAIHSAVSEILKYFTANPNTAALLNQCLDKDSYLNTHVGNVFYLSMLLGSTVKDYVAAERKRQTLASDLSSSVALDLAPMGIGTFFMDLGMLELEALLKADKPLSESDREAIFEHPSRGADALPQNFPAAAKMIVRTHHENFDGSGYPRKMPGEKLHVFTRIVRIADAYDSATAQRVYKKAKSPARALWEMTVGPYRRFYDPTLMKAFSRLIQPFPIGAKLRIKDGRYAVVTRYNRKNAFEPDMVISFDANDQPLPKESMEGPVSPTDEPEYHLRSFRGEDLSYLHNPEPEPAAPRETFATLFESVYP